MAIFDADDERAQFPNWAHFCSAINKTPAIPIAISEMAYRLPGGIDSPGLLWQSASGCERSVPCFTLALTIPYRVWQRADMEATGMVYSSTSSRVVHVRTTDCARCADG